MRDSAPPEVLANVASYGPSVSSWLAGDVLADNIPIIGGRLTATVSQKVPERVTMTVPRRDRQDWLPQAPEDALATFGQELDVQIIVESAVTGIAYETPTGRFPVQDWDYDDGSGNIGVTGVGRMQLIADDRLTSPLAPRKFGTLASEFERLLPDGFSVNIHDDLVDRPCPQSMEWAEDRLDALYEIADAWPARLRTDQWGQLELLPPLPDVAQPILTLTDGENGTVVGVNRSDTRDQAYNVIVVRASGTDDPEKPPIQAIAEQTTGPMRVDGPYGRVVKFWSSPLITTEGQARKSAQTMLRNSLRPTAVIPIALVPDPRINLDDPVEVIRDGIKDWGYVIAYDLPLTVNDGEMRIDIGVGGA